MSIIERMVELLGPAESSNPKRSMPKGPGSGDGLDTIERALDESNQKLASGPGGAGTSQRHVRPVRSNEAARILRINRDLLRRQSFISPAGERTAVAESFRRVKWHILAKLAKPKDGGPPANLVLVTSALAGEGKTFCAINLAISIASEMDRTVLLVDTDMARPSIPQALGLQVDRGLTDVLLDRQVDLADVICRTDIEKLSLLPVGTAHHGATEVLASDAMRELLQDMAARYRDRVIVFDSPPLLAASESAVLASYMGQIVMVVEAGRTTQPVLKEALGRIDEGNLTGLLLNKGEGPGMGYGGYGYGAK